MQTIANYFQASAPPGIVSAYLFGSAARGAAHRESDIDVAVLLDYGAHPDRAARRRVAERLIADLVGVTHRNELDVVVLNDAPPELAVAAAVHGRRLFCANERVDRDFGRTVQLRLADLRPFLERTRRLKVRALAR